MPQITEYITPLLEGRDLTFEQASAVLDTVFAGGVSDVQLAAFLAAMRAKGACAAELAGLAGSLRRHAVPVKAGISDLVDTCGTGGAAVKTFNISTAAALVAAGAGCYVAKHGNRGITSACGSADCLAELGVRIDAGPEVVAKCIRSARMGFMFAPRFHPAMKHVQPVRKALGFRTVFNVLGPLANPAGAARQVLGVADERLMEPVAEALGILGVRYAMVVHSEGLDEMSTAAVTKIVEVKDGRFARRTIDAGRFGLQAAEPGALRVSGAAEGAAVVRAILAGSDTGCRRDIVVLNAAAAIIAAGLEEDFAAAVGAARAAVDGGGAMECLEKLVEISAE
jgi:anthranilate phosphoribosyltransferase